MPKYKCAICGKESEGYGNNPWPLFDDEDDTKRVCGECDFVYVQTARILNSQETRDSWTPKEIEAFFPMVNWVTTRKKYQVQQEMIRKMLEGNS